MKSIIELLAACEQNRCDIKIKFIPEYSHFYIALSKPLENGVRIQQVIQILPDWPIVVKEGAIDDLFNEFITFEKTKL